METIESFQDRVIHADCLKALPGMPSESIDLVATDPPYLVNYRARDGRRCNGDDTDHWLMPAFRELYRVLKPDSFCVSFYGWPWVDRFMAVWKECGFRPVSHLVCVKSHCSRRGYTESFHEVGYLLAKGRPVRPDRPIRDVLPWEYTGNRFHPNEKPLVAIVPLIEAYSKPGDTVLDPFGGSGTTALAAMACNRRFVLIEKTWEHAQVSRHRIERASA